MTVNEMYDTLLELGIVTQDEISLVVSIVGMNTDTMEKILYSRTGYSTFESMMEDEED